jgi:multidrug resistance efflux pump
MNPSITSHLSNAGPTDSDLAALDPTSRNAFRFAARRDNVPEPVRTQAAPAAPVAPKTRPRGRLLIATLMLLACSAGIFSVWDSLLRYRAYGVVTGRIIEVGVPIEGVLTAVHVSEGETVRQDSKLATVEDLEYEHELARVSDELRITEATLQAEIARVQWQSHVEETEMTKSIAELFESAGRMHNENGALELLRYQLNFNRDLHKKNAASRVDLDSFEIQERAKKEELESIEQAIVVLKQRATKAAESPRLGKEQIQPLIAKSEMLLNEIKRLRARNGQGEVKSPVNGTVLRRIHPAGECIKENDALFAVMEEASLEIEMYLPQDMSAKYKVGDVVKVKIEPFEELVPCEVTAIGAEHRKPPEHIEVFYRTNIRLLPVRVRPQAPFATDRRMAVGAVAKLPHFGMF